MLRLISYKDEEVSLFSRGYEMIFRTTKDMILKNQVSLCFIQEEDTILKRANRDFF
jgi:hypothetical protein